MSKVDVNGCIHGVDGRFLPKQTYDDGIPPVIEYVKRDTVINPEDMIKYNGENPLTPVQYASLCSLIANIKRRDGDDFEYMDHRLFNIHDDVIAVVSGTFEEIEVNYAVSYEHYMHYYLLMEAEEGDED